MPRQHKLKLVSVFSLLPLSKDSEGPPMEPKGTHHPPIWSLCVCCWEYCANYRKEEKEVNFYGRYAVLIVCLLASEWVGVTFSRQGWRGRIKVIKIIPRDFLKIFTSLSFLRRHLLKVIIVSASPSN